MTGASVALILVPLLLIGSLAPGLAVVRRLRCSPLEKLCAAMAASFVLVYLISFALFCANAPTWAYWAASAIFCLVGCLNARQIKIFLHRRRSRSAILAFIVVLLWEFLQLALVRNMGGGTWAGDWYEQYDRTRYFLHQLPDSFTFAYLYALPARPPMMNLIAAFYCRQVGWGFECFSLVFFFLNAFTFLPCCLLLRHLGRRASRSIPALAALFMLNPSILQNVIFTWTKAMTAGLVILAVCFYLRGLKSPRFSWRIVAVALCLAAAMLVHYSAGAFAVAIAVHYFLRIFRRPIGEAAASALAAIALLCTWAAWSIHEFGWHKTIYSNTTLYWNIGRSRIDEWALVFYDYFSSIVPHPLHPPADWFHTVNNWGAVRDYYFLMSQTTLPMMIGCTAGFVVALLLIRFFLFSRGRLAANKFFWVLFLFLGYLLGLASAPGVYPFGAAHLALQPLAIVGVAYLATRLRNIPAVLFWIVLAGAAVDYALGIYLNFDRHSHVYAVVGSRATELSVVPTEEYGFGVLEYSKKVLENYTFWGDYFANVIPLLKIISVVVGVWTLAWLVRWRYCRS